MCGQTYNRPMDPMRDKLTVESQGMFVGESLAQPKKQIVQLSFFDPRIEVRNNRNDGVK